MLPCSRSPAFKIDIFGILIMLGLNPPRFSSQPPSYSLKSFQKSAESTASSSATSVYNLTTPSPTSQLLAPLIFGVCSSIHLLFCVQFHNERKRL